MTNLRDRYCIAGVGETEYSHSSGRTTRAMAVEAVRAAMRDAGLGAGDVDGMMSYQSNDSTPSNWMKVRRGAQPSGRSKVVRYWPTGL